VTAVAPGANRPSDGRRLLRFLTSLALLALAVTLRLPVQAAPAPLEAVPAPVPPVTAAVIPEPGPAAASETSVTEERPARALPAPPPAEAAATVTGSPAPALRAGVVPAAGGPRAPPTR
jgi:hypothetical protein